MKQLITFHSKTYYEYVRDTIVWLLSASHEDDLIRAKDIITWLINNMKPGVCPLCNGSGRRIYGKKVTWATSLGGQQHTSDVCDECWGTGSIKHPGINLKRCADYLKAQVPEDADSKHARIYWGNTSPNTTKCWVVEYLRGDKVLSIIDIESRPHGIACVKASDAAWVDIHMPHGTYERIIMPNNIKQMR